MQAVFTQNPARANALDRSRRATKIVVMVMMAAVLPMIRPRWSALISKPGSPSGGRSGSMVALGKPEG